MMLIVDINLKRRLIEMQVIVVRVIVGASIFRPIKGIQFDFTSYFGRLSLSVLIFRCGIIGVILIDPFSVLIEDRVILTFIVVTMQQVLKTRPRTEGALE